MDIVAKQMVASYNLWAAVLWSLFGPVVGWALYVWSTNLVVIR